MPSVTCPKCGAATEVPDGVAFAVRCDTCASRIPLRQQPAPDIPAAELVDDEPAAARFPVSSFKLAPRGGPAALVPVAAVALLAAVVLGLACSLIGQVFWLVIFFAILHGLGVGFAAGYAARTAKVRRPTALMLIAGAAGLFSAFLIHVFDNLTQAPGVGFLQFEDMRATSGVRLGDDGTNLGYTGSILYWLFEAIVTMCAAGNFAVEQTSTPFCERCEGWKAKRVLGPFRLDPVAAAEALKRGTPTEAVVEGDESCRVVIHLFPCEQCRKDGQVEVQLAGTWSHHGKPMTVAAAFTLPGAALPALYKIEAECKDQNLVLKE